MKPYARLVGMLLCLAGSAASQTPAAEVERIDLAKNTRFEIRRAASQVTLRLENLVPGAEYRVGESAEIVKLPKIQDPGAGNAQCEEPAKYVNHLLATATDEKKVASALASIDPDTCADASKKAAAVLAKTRAEETTRHSLAARKLTGTVRKLTISGPEDRTWVVRIGAADAVEPSELPADRLDEIMATMAGDHSEVILECSYPDLKCEDDPLFVNADHVSAIVFRGLTTGKGLTVTADPLTRPIEGCESLRRNVVRFEQGETPDTVVVTLHLFRKPFWSFFGKDRRPKEGLRLFGLPPGVSGKTVDEMCSSAFAGYNVRKTVLLNSAVSSNARQKGIGNSLLEAQTAIPVIVDGRTERVNVTFAYDGEAPRVFPVRFHYQRWWAEGGGAFLFPRQKEVRISTTEVSPGVMRLDRIEKDRSTEPETGIVINIHPGNYPEIAFQFGLSTASESNLTYYLGTGVRLREIGRRGLATFTVGIALIESQRYPGLVVATDATGTVAERTPGFYLATDPRLQGESGYDIQGYFGISLGFAFGGVSSGAGAVKVLP